MGRGRALLGICCRLGLGLLPVLPGAGETVLKSECEDTRVLRAQLICERPGFSWLLSLSRGGDGSAVVRPGLQSPFVTAGPIRRAGLLRLLYRPLRYRPDSDLFREDTGLELDRRLKSGWLSGLLFEPWPGRLGLFTCAAPGREASGGTFIRLGGREGAFFEALALLSRPPPDEQGQEWVTVPAPHPGGRLLHLGARAGGDFPGLTLNLSLALSGGERAAPGRLALVQAAGRRGRAEAALVCGLCSPDYRTPDGRGGRPHRQAGLRLSWGRGGSWQAGALAELLLEPAAEGCPPGPAREFRGELDTRLLLDGRRASWRLEGGIAVEARQEAEAGWAPRRPLPEAGLALEGVRNRLALSWAGGAEDRLELEARGRRPGLTWRGALETLLPAARCFKAGGALELVRDGGRFYLRLSCRDWLDTAGIRRDGVPGLMESTAFTMGWETRASMPADRRGEP